jgi:hypothetical protein
MNGKLKRWEEENLVYWTAAKRSIIVMSQT